MLDTEDNRSKPDDYAIKSCLSIQATQAVKQELNVMVFYSIN